MKFLSVLFKQILHCDDICLAIVLFSVKLRPRKKLPLLLLTFLKRKQGCLGRQVGKTFISFQIIEDNDIVFNSACPKMVITLGYELKIIVGRLSRHTGNNTPATKLQGGILVSPYPSVHLQTNLMSYDNLSYVSQNLLKFYQLFTGEERRIPFFFDDFHFCRSRVIGLDMTENRIFTLCRMIT